jgi:hypothetical protein
MAWSHIVLEGYCLFEIDDDCKEEVPECCINEPGNVGTYCLSFKEHKHCPYFAFGTARASVVVTDDKGQSVTGTCFFPKNGLSLSNEEWVRKENAWIKKWARKITGNKDNKREECKYKIWIEAENATSTKDVFDDNTDVIVNFEDGSKYIASFFTYSNVNSLVSKNNQSGECMFGKYFWSSDMILAEDISRQTIENVIAELIKTDEFESVFRCCKQA